MTSYEKYSVLVLGSGFVTKPAVEVLSQSKIRTTVASRALQHAQKICQDLPHTSAISLDVTDESALDAAVRQHDLVVSLIPYTFHTIVIRACIREKKNCVTTSYVSKDMMALDADAKKAGITVLNEIGLDPGIDHLEAVRIIDETHNRGAKIRSFYSYVGGLPAPEASDNPLGYKFSWSPRGVLLAARNDAKFYKDGKVVSIPGSDLMNNAKPWLIYPGFAFYGYPNRDSTPYKERYRIPEAENLVRGSLRYQGNPSFVQTLNDLGFLSDEKIPELSEPIPWAEATKHVIKAASSSTKDLEAAIQSRTKFPSADDQSRILAGLRWIGLFSATEKITPRGTPLDILCASLETKCAYGPDERDMVMLQHKFEIESPDGSVEWRTSTLIEFGNPNGFSAMAYLVGTPCAVAIKCVLSGAVSDKGILAPLNAKINEPIMKQLEEYKIRFVEKTLA